MRALKQQQAELYKQKTGVQGAPHLKKKGLPSSMTKNSQDLEGMNLDRRSEDSGIQNIYDPFAKKTELDVQLQAQDHKMGMKNTNKQDVWMQQ